MSKGEAVKEIEMIEGQSCCFTTDRTLVSGGPARPVRRGSDDPASVM